MILFLVGYKKDHLFYFMCDYGFSRLYQGTTINDYYISIKGTSFVIRDNEFKLKKLDVTSDYFFIENEKIYSFEELYNLFSKKSFYYSFKKINILSDERIY